MRFILSVLSLLLLTTTAFAQTITFPNYIGSLTAAATTTGADTIYLLQGGASKAITLNGLLTHINPTGGGSAFVSPGFAIDGLGGISSTKAITYVSGTGATPAIAGIYFNNAASGTCTNATGCAANRFIIPSDTITGGLNNVIGWQFTHNFGGTAASGNRIAASYQLILNSPTSNHFDATGEGSYAALTASVTANSGDNGNGLTKSTAAGQIQTINFIGRSNSGATNLYQVSPAEFNTEVKTGSSTFEKIGIAIVDLFDSAVQGSGVDTALSIANQVGAVGWKLGIGFGRPDGQWPIASTGTVIGCEGGTCGTAVNGIDFHTATFTGASILMPLSTPSSSSATCTTGAIEWDAGYIYVCTTTDTWKRSALAGF